MTASGAGRRRSKRDSNVSGAVMRSTSGRREPAGPCSARARERRNPPPILHLPCLLGRLLALPLLERMASSSKEVATASTACVLQQKVREGEIINFHWKLSHDIGWVMQPILYGPMDFIGYPRDDMLVFIN